MVYNTVVSPPVPPYSNPPINPEYYKPRNFIISAISLGPTTTITTTLDMDYVIGQLIRLLIPSKYGSRELNEQIGYVIDIPATNEVVVDINSSNASAFIASPTFLPFESKTVPQIVPVGDINTGAINPFGREFQFKHIPGSFINISPL